MISLLRGWHGLRALVLAVVLSSAPVRAAEPLSLDEVLRSSATHAPQILEAMARERQADGRVEAARGAFDTVFEGDLQARPLGYYDGSYVEARAARPLETNGGGLYGGYRVSTGTFASYDGKAATNRLGEVKAGAVFSLLRDRFTDERRTRLGLAADDREVARLEREMVAIGVQRRAIDAYQQWALAGLRTRIFRDLLDLASERQASIERQVELGARPAVLAIENRQNIVRREALLVRAEQDLAVAANALSFFYRDGLGAPIVPAADRLPAEFPLLRVATPGPEIIETIDRPDLDAILVRLDQAAARRRLAENELRPRLDVRVEASKDFGPGGELGPTRAPAEAMVGLRFAVPLQQRQAKGRIAEATAEADGLTIRRRQVEDQILIEVNNLATQVQGAERLAVLAVDEAALATRMAEAERRRFSLGASDFIVVNLREEAAADARLRQADAEYRKAAARAELAAALADRQQLGLAEASLPAE